MFPKIICFETRPDRTLKLRFDSVAEGIVDLQPLISKGGIFGQLEDEHYFSQAELDATGRSIYWPGYEIELGADGLLRDLQTPAKLR
jgi:hypothetical protein